MANSASIPKGTRDFLPEQSLKRQYIFDTARSVFQLYGYQPIETPAMENLETLTGKYGEEGDKLIFRILDSGDKPNRSLSNETYAPLNDLQGKGIESLNALFRDCMQEWCTKPESSLDDLRQELVKKFQSDFSEAISQNDGPFMSGVFEYLLNFWLNDDGLGTRAETHRLNFEKKPAEGFRQLNIVLAFLNKREDFKQWVNAIKARTVIESQSLSSILSEKALRYDLTVPFARFVVQNQNELNFPFKRFQIQPVWRADRPQKGRYREFYQCDVDVIGSDSLLNEAELLCIVNDVFTKLGLGDIVIRINNRKILSGIATSAGLSEYFTEMTVAIDKIDKIGLDGVRDEMIKRGLPEGGVKKVLDHIKRKGEVENVLRMLAGSLTGSEEAQRGIKEVEKMLKALPAEVKAKVQLDLTLARGLNYYTGAIIEVGHADFPSSICGGGRYDDLTGIFGLKGMSGVGVSLGADRIFDLMNELNLFPESLKAASEVLFVNFGDAEAGACLKLAAELRKDAYSAEVYPNSAKMQKQMKYANDRGFHFVVMIGSDELKAGKATVKDMQSGEQYAVLQKDLAKFVMEKNSAE